MITNNVVETTYSRINAAINFYQCDEQDIRITLTNNLVIGARVAVADFRGGGSATTTHAGDFRPIEPGPGAGTGINLYDDATTGNVVIDIMGNSRPASGAWSRGPYLP